MTDITPTFQNVNPPTQKTLMDAHKREIQKSINCIRIGIIQDFDETTQLATVAIAQQQVTSVQPDGTRTLAEYPLLGMVPVFTLFGGLDFMSMPVTKGDNCIVLFNDRELDNWLQTGAGTTPTVGRVHDLSDGIALVGINPLVKSIATYLANGIRLSHASGGDISKIDLVDALIHCTAQLFKLDGDMTISGDFVVEGVMNGDGEGEMVLNTSLRQNAGFEIHAGNGATGSFTTVTVVDGIVTGGS